MGAWSLIVIESMLQSAASDIKKHMILNYIMYSIVYIINYIENSCANKRCKTIGFKSFKNRFSLHITLPEYMYLARCLNMLVQPHLSLSCVVRW